MLVYASGQCMEQRVFTLVASCATWNGGGVVSHGGAFDVAVIRSCGACLRLYCAVYIQSEVAGAYH